ncbi:uncharacterized protein LOC110094298 [Dendrobium catenatum]|uniref:uncharacterized protein LOC110094298 n=1 Tax=Dendrobium catenatum TaxID=906689 RepID=UPI0009F6B6D8|nr:uncharacterized protein LOC110094298 [Dendrobium catenatum]
MAAWNIRGFNHPDKVFACKRLIQSHKLDLICILENRINILSFQDPFFEISHSLFPNEASCNNFALNSSGRIWIKWNASKICFKPTQISPQIISGFILVANQPILHLSAIYASNNQLERKELWEAIADIHASINLPWALMGDYNCCRFASDKLGGIPISMSSLADFNTMIFNNGLKDLTSVGLNYSWFNQRSDNPIHIKLDHVLVNDLWLESFAGSYCSFQNPSCSDHTPILLHSGNPLSHFSNSLKLFKECIKKEGWSSSNCVKKHLDALLGKQKSLLELLQMDHNNREINLSYKAINSEVANFLGQLGEVYWT